ncbi:MAG: hypothetical protein LKG06_04910 [Bifidobacterium subtile]|jgi:hypothetical protein|nr:hypothetical protein [Bifidobacterium subtile]
MIGFMPICWSSTLMAAHLVGEDLREDDAGGRRGHNVRQQHAHAPEGLGFQVRVQDPRQQQGQHDLRHGAQQEDRYRIAQRDIEGLLVQDPCEIAEP